MNANSISLPFRRASTAALIAGALALPVAAQTSPAPATAAPAIAPMQSARLQPGEVIPMDGTLNHPAWQRAPVFDQFTERDPTNGAKPKFETRVQVLVGERAVYVGVTALDPAPELIRQALVRHDQVRRTQDFVVLYLDPMGTKKSAQWFRVGAAGSTSDGMHTAEDDNEDFSPDFDFDAASARNPQGYTAVFRVPFASLRYTRDTGVAGPWRIMVARRVPREQSYLLTSVPLPVDAPSFIANLQPLEGVTVPAHANFLQLRPNLTWRRTTESAPGQNKVSDTRLNLGLDMKWRPTPELVVDATLKPDFSQVELDVPQLSRNTRFALFTEEKRPFFLESSDLLRSPTDALYTRSVALPRWGVRASLRTEALAGTAFALRDLGGSLVLLPGSYGTGVTSQPPSIAAAARVRTNREGLTLGAIASLRRYDDARGDNAVIGPDLTWQATDALRLRAQWLTARTTALADAQGGLTRADAQTGSRLYGTAFWRIDGYEASASVDDIGKNFRNDNGFLTQSGVRKLGFELHRILRGVARTNELWFNLNGEIVRDKDTRQMVSGYLTPGIYTNYSNNSEATIEYRGLSRLRTASGAPLLGEKYWHFYYTRTPALWIPQVSAELDVGRIADVTANQVRSGQRLSLSAKLRPLGRLELEPSYSQALLKNEAGRAYTETAAQLLGIWHLAPQQTLRLIVQRTGLDRRAEPGLAIASARDASTAQSLTWTWRRSAGTVLYVGASRGTSGVTGQQGRSTEVFLKLQADVDELRG